MQLMEDIFFSFTFGGETLSLAASLAVLTKLQREPVVEQLSKTGQNLLDQLNELIHEFEFEHIFSVTGFPVWSFLVIKDTEKFTSLELKTLLLQEMFANGIFMIGTHNISYSHSHEDIAYLMKSYRLYFEKVKTAVEKNSISDMLLCEPLVPLFKLR
jgi:glutamate-1-semialdehyde 2,1-aminomutase